MKNKADVIETMKASIDAVINGDRKHGWGQADSMAVIGDLVAEFAPSFAKGTPEHGDAAANEVRNAVLAGINQMVNPSAARQWLESSKVDKLAKSEGRKAASNKLFAEF